MLLAYLLFPLVTNQIELSLYHHAPLTDGSVDHLIQNRVKPMACSPLGGGAHFGKDDDHSMQLAKGLASLSMKYNEATSSQLLLAWLLRHPAQILPVIGTTKSSRIAEAAEAVAIDLDRQDWFEMWRLVRGREID
jgi:predicted oxidoreductase